jgi:hypothetical protein
VFQFGQGIVAQVDKSDDAPSTQEIFKVMIRDHVSPAMRELGFKGSTGKYSFTSGDWTGRMEVQKSVWNTQDVVEFTFNLMVHHIPTIPTGKPYGIWSISLCHLVPMKWDYWWEISPSTDIEEMTENIIAILRDFGLPAIKAVMSIASPPKPQVRPVMVLSHAGQMEESRVLHEKSRAESMELQRVRPILQVCPINELIEWTYNDADFVRREAVRYLEMRAIHSPKTSLRLVEVLQSVEDPFFRRGAAISLAHVNGSSVVDAALEIASRDESFDVRWSALFALQVQRNSARSGQSDNV